MWTWKLCVVSTGTYIAKTRSPGFGGHAYHCLLRYSLIMYLFEITNVCSTFVLFPSDSRRRDVEEIVKKHPHKIPVS